MKLKYENNEATKETKILIDLVVRLDHHKKEKLLKNLNIRYEIQHDVYYFYNKNNQIIMNGKHDFYCTINSFILKNELIQLFKLKTKIENYKKNSYGIIFEIIDQEFKKEYDLEYDFMGQIENHDGVYVYLNNNEIEIIK